MDLNHWSTGYGPVGISWLPHPYRHHPKKRWQLAMEGSLHRLMLCLSGISLPILKPITFTNHILQMEHKVLIPWPINILRGEMMEKVIETRLIKRHSQFPTVCIYCSKQILPNSLHYVEEGVTGHIHSLIARKFCNACYSKYGEQLLLHEIRK